MRYLVVHAHLYQPPRENPWTEVVERQPSACPFHDWSERVSDECYERLGAAGVRGPDGRIVSLVNLYGRCSFNIGPTLAAWLDNERPDALADAAAGDRAAIERTGHGSALMQPYGHPILPLCEPRERKLQIEWGKADFRRRFGRAPVGVWLPECAVDLASLEACADAGLSFTVVAPEQVLRIRALNQSHWEDVSGSRVPPHRPYMVRLPSGRRFTIFVFDGPLSRGVAFGGRLHSGNSLLDGFRAALDGVPGPDGVVLLAADGETFGHHQKGAEGVLAEALIRVRMNGLAQVSHLGEVFHKVPVTHEAVLAEPSAWSCAHGVGRWERDCGCNAGASGHGWNWGWRQVLRHGVSLLRDRVFSLVDRHGGALFKDPWAACADYGDVLVNPRSLPRLLALLDRHAVSGLGEEERARAASMLELVRQTLFSATSCGWFFDDIAGLEAVQVMRHAARASELCRDVFGIDPEPQLIATLEQARANEHGAGSGGDVYRRRAQSARRDLTEAAAIHALARMNEALTTSTTPSAISTSYGAYVCDSAAPPEVEYDPSGLVEVRGAVTVTHLRTGLSRDHRYALVSPAPGAAIRLTIDDSPGPSESPAVRERLLQVIATRAARLLPAPAEELLLALAWIGLEARQTGAPLPSPFPEALRGGGRALVQDMVARPARSPRDGARALAGALRAARSAGLLPEEIADLRPAIDRLLASYASWIESAGENGEALEDLVGAVDAARLAAGEQVLSRLRRFVVDRYANAYEPRLAPLLRATGLAPDALVPLDTPVRAVSDDKTKDALV